MTALTVILFVITDGQTGGRSDLEFGGRSDLEFVDHVTMGKRGIPDRNITLNVNFDFFPPWAGSM